MTDREKLVEIISSAEYKSGWTIGERFYRDWIEMIADHLIANGVTVQEWRDAKTDPPTEWKDADGCLNNFLVYCPEYGVDVGNYVEPAKRWVVVGLPAPVTYWQPLPESPKGES